MLVVRVNKEEFELEDGSIFPIEPSLDYEPTIEEFQEHYDRACDVMRSLGDAGSLRENIARLGRERQDPDH